MTEPFGIYFSEAPGLTTIVHRRYVPHRFGLIVQLLLAISFILLVAGVVSAHLVGDASISEIYGLWCCVVAVGGVLIWLRFAKTTITADANEICVRLDVLVHYKTTRMPIEEISVIQQEHDAELGDDGSCLCFVRSQGWRVRCLNYLPYATTDWIGRKLAALCEVPYTGTPANADNT